MKLPNALKIRSFSQLRDRLHSYLKEHQGRLPDFIWVNKRQHHEYWLLFHRNCRSASFYEILSFQGIELRIHEERN